MDAALVSGVCKEIDQIAKSIQITNFGSMLNWFFYIWFSFDFGLKILEIEKLYLILILKNLI